MFEYNALTVNDVSTAEFPFMIYVEKNDGFRYPQKKNQLIETEYTTGASKNTIEAWETIPKGYTLYCPTATLKDMRQIKLWATDSGYLIAGDEPDVRYEIVDVAIDHSQMSTGGGYRINITFTTQPFGFELEQPINTYQNNSTIRNHTNAPMFPKVIVYGNANSQTSIQIGEQTIYLKKLQTKYTIECMFLEQNLFDQYNNPINSQMRGDFFVIPKNDYHIIKFGQGIDKIEIVERWGWL